MEDTTENAPSDLLASVTSLQEDQPSDKSNEVDNNEAPSISDQQNGSTTEEAGVITNNESNDVNNDSSDLVADKESSSAVENNDSSNVIENNESSNVLENNESNNVVENNDVVNDKSSDAVVNNEDSDDIVNNEKSDAVVVNSESSDIINNENSDVVNNEDEVINADNDVVMNNGLDLVNTDLCEFADINLEIESPDQKPEDFTSEEAVLYQEMFGPDKQKVQFLRLHCTACNEHLGSAPNMQHKRYIHPLLKVLQCKKCFDFYRSGEFDKDEDGSELYCRWCGQGGNVLCCSQCCFVFCQRCIRANVGKRALTKIKESDDWTCFACAPEQTTKSRVTCKALYNFIQDEIKAASELQEPGRLNVDHSLCCKEKLKTILTEKRKRSNSFEHLYAQDSDDETYKIKKKKMKTVSHMSNVNVHKKSYLAPEPSTIWESQIEDEVVCTPDLSMLMDDDDSPAQPATETPPPIQPISPVPSCSTVLPPLVPLPQTNSRPTKGPDIQFVSQTRVVAPQRKAVVVSTSNLVTSTGGALGYKLPVILNPVTTSKPPAAANNVQKAVVPNFVHLQAPAVKFSDNNEVQPIVRVAHNKTSSVINATPAKLAPGLRYEWFEKATQLTARVNQNLSQRVCALSKEQYTVTSLEGLASIHNNLQEILSNSINSLMQIRKSLRSDFINGLKKLKFCKTPTQTIHDDKDNDVVLVDSTRPTSNTEQTTPANSTNAAKPTGYIKVKPVSELFDSSIITIPDENSSSNNNNRAFSFNKDFLPQQKNVTAPAKKNDNMMLNGLLSNRPNSRPPVINRQVTTTINKSTITSNLPKQDKPKVIVNTDARTLMKRALFESKFENIVKDNMKYNMEKVSPRDLKRMLSVRVVMESDFGKSTLRMKPRKGYKPMNIRPLDLEDILSSSVIVNIAKKKDLNKSATNEKDDEINLLSDDDGVEIISEETVSKEKKADSQESNSDQVIELDKSDVQQEDSEESAKATKENPEASEKEQSSLEKQVDKGKTINTTQQDSTETAQKETTQEETSEKVTQEEMSEKVAQEETSEKTAQKETSKEVFPQQQDDGDNESSEKGTNESSEKGTNETTGDSEEITRPTDDNVEALNEITNQLLEQSEPVLKDVDHQANDPTTTDSGIDVQGEQSLSNGVMDCQEN